MKSLLIIALLILNGCSSFEELAYNGMDKNSFVDTMSRNQMSFRPIYFNREMGIEMWLPTRTVKYSLDLNKTAQIAIFEKVTRPRPRYTALTMRVPGGYCQNWVGYCYDFGDGRLLTWFTEDALENKALNGEDWAKLLITAIQLDREQYETQIDHIMKRDLISKDAAERSYMFANLREQNSYREIKKIELKRDQDLKKGKVPSQSQTYTYYDPEYDAYRTVNSQPIQKPQVRSKVSSSLGPLFGRLIEAVLDAYIDEKLGLNTSNSNLSKSDLERIEEASRKGMRRAIKQQKRKDSMKWTAPIR